MDFVRTIAKNFFYLVSAEFLIKVINVAVTAYIARTLLPDNFGKINFAMTFVLYFSALVMFGLEITGVKRISVNKDKIDQIVGYVNGLKVITFFCILTIFSGIILFMDKSGEVKILILLYMLGAIPLVFGLEWAFQGIEKMGYVAISKIIYILLYGGSVYVFINNRKDLFKLPCFQIIVASVSAAFLIYIFNKKISKFKFSFDFKYIKNLAKESYIIAITNFLILIIGSFNIIMLGLFCDDKDVGFYNAAYKLIFFLISFLAIYFAVVFPKMSYFYKTSHSDLIKLLETSSKIMFIISFIIGLTGVLFAKPIILFLYGTEYLNSIFIFKVLSWLILVLSINSILGRALWACDEANFLLKIVIIQALFGISLSFILIPLFKAKGAAFVILGGELIGFPFYYHYIKKIVSFKLFTNALKPLISALIVAAISLYLINFKFHLFINLSIVLILYIIILFLTRTITESEWETVKYIINKRKKMIYR